MSELSPAEAADAEWPVKSPGNSTNAASADRAAESSVRRAKRGDPQPRPKYHLAIVGNGPAARIAAELAAALGAQVALISDSSRNAVGASLGPTVLTTLIDGSCEAKRDGPSAFARVLEKVREAIERPTSRPATERLAVQGIDVFRGEGRFRDSASIDCDGRPIRFSRALLVPGETSIVPDLPGFAETGYFTMETLYLLDGPPGRVAVLGCGASACELAQAFARFGSRVTLIDPGARILPDEDEQAAEVVAAGLRREGVYIATSSEIAEASRTTEGACLRFRDDRHSPLFADAIVVAGERRSNVDALGLEAAGIAVHPDRGLVSDDFYRSSARTIFVANGPDLETSVRIAVRNALLGERGKRSGIAARYVRTAPALIQIGLTASDARTNGQACETCQVAFPAGDEAAGGFVRAIVARGTDRVLGITAVGDGALDLAGEAMLAVSEKLGLRRLGELPRPNGTRGEVFRRLSDEWRRAETARRARRIAWTLRWSHGVAPRE